MGTLISVEYQKVCSAYRNTKRRCEEATLREVKARYKKEQPVIDIQRQPENLPAAGSKDMKAEAYIFVERVRAVDTLFTFTTPSPKAECRRRVAAVDALTALCQLQEGRGFRRWKPASDTKLKRARQRQYLSQHVFPTPSRLEVNPLNVSSASALRVCRQKNACGVSLVERT